MGSAAYPQHDPGNNGSIARRRVSSRTVSTWFEVRLGPQERNWRSSSGLRVAPAEMRRTIYVFAACFFSGNASQAHAEIIERTTEIYCRPPGPMAGTAPSLSRPSRALGECCFGQTAGKLGVVETAAADRLGDSVVDVALVQEERIGEEVVGAEKVPPHADRPGGRGHVERQRLLDLVQQVERVAALAVELVDEGQDRHVAQPADVEEFAGLLLDAPLAPLGAASSTITALSIAVSVR
jgi:hypothetical protein